MELRRLLLLVASPLVINATAPVPTPAVTAVPTPTPTAAPAVPDPAMPSSEVTTACLVTKVSATVQSQDMQSVTNANFWLRTSPNASMAGCHVSETDQGITLQCEKPICAIDYKLELAGLLAKQDEGSDLTWQLEGAEPVTAGLTTAGTGNSVVQLASGASPISAVESEPVAATPAPGTAPAEETPEFSFPTYPFKPPSCSMPCFATAAPVWSLLKQGAFVNTATPHTALNVLVKMQYDNVPWYPVTSDELRTGLAMAYGLDGIQIEIQNVTQLPPSGTYNTSTLYAQYILWSFAQLPAAEMEVAPAVQAAQQEAVKMANTYVNEEVSRLTTLNTEYANNAEAMRNFFEAAISPGKAVVQQSALSADIAMSSTTLGATAISQFPPTSYGKPSVPVSVSATFPTAMTPIFQVVSTMRINLESDIDRTNLAGTAGQLVLQDAIATYLGVDATALEVLEISFSATTVVTQLTSYDASAVLAQTTRRLQESSQILPGMAGGAYPMNVKVAAQANAMNDVLTLRQHIISGAYGVPGLGGSSSRLLGNLTAKCTAAGVGLPTKITSAGPLPGGIYSRMVIPGHRTVPPTPPPTVAFVGPCSTELISAVTVGATKLPLEQTACFTPGEYVTISSSGSQETVMLSMILPDVTTGSGLTKAYPKGATVSALAQVQVTTLAVSALQGATSIDVVSTAGFAVGDTIKIAEGAVSETNTVTNIASLMLGNPLANAYSVGATVTTVTVTTTVAPSSSSSLEWWMIALLALMAVLAVVAVVMLCMKPKKKKNTPSKKRALQPSDHMTDSELAPLKGEPPVTGPLTEPNAFDAIDTNHDGVITQAEFEAAQRQMQQTRSRSEVPSASSYYAQPQIQQTYQQQPQAYYQQPMQTYQQQPVTYPVSSMAVPVASYAGQAPVATTYAMQNQPQMYYR